MASPKQIAFGVLTIALLIGCVYAAALDNAMVWHDDSQIRSNGDNLRLHEIGRFFLESDAHHSSERFGDQHYRPLLFASYALDATLFGHSNARAFHAINLLWHLLAVLLFFTVVLRVSKRLRLTLAASVIIAIHPAFSETVFYLGGREFSMLATFSLAAMLTATCRLSTKPKAALIGGLFGAALLCDASAAVAAPLILMLVFTLRPNDERAGRPIVLALALVTAGYILLRNAALSSLAVAPTTQSVTMLGYIADLSAYLGHAFVYPLTSIPCRTLTHLPPLQMTVCVAALIACVAASSITICRSTDSTPRLLAFGLIWYIMAVAGVAYTVAPEQTFGERHGYFACFGLALAVGIGFDRLCSLVTVHFSRIGAALLIALLVTGPIATFAISTYQRSADWHSDEKLFTSVEAQDPYNPHGSLAFGDRFMAEQQPSEALVMYRRVLETHYSPRWVIATAYRKMIRAAIAERQYYLALDYAKRLLEHSRADPKTQFSLGLALYHLATKEKWSRPGLMRASGHFQKALRHMSNGAAARSYLASISHLLRQPKTSLSREPDKSGL